MVDPFETLPAGGHWPADPIRDRMTSNDPFCKASESAYGACELLAPFGSDLDSSLAIDSIDSLAVDPQALGTRKFVQRRIFRAQRERSASDFRWVRNAAPSWPLRCQPAETHQLRGWTFTLATTLQKIDGPAPLCGRHLMRDARLLLKASGIRVRSPETGLRAQGFDCGIQLPLLRC